MELGHTLDPVGDAGVAGHLSGLVHHAHIAMVPGPVHIDEDHLFLFSTLLVSSEECGGDLMDQSLGTTPQPPSVSSPIDRGTV
jgi:hypothetical protein